MPPRTANFEDGLHATLQDLNEAAAYLNAALAEDDQEIFLLALRDIATARGLTHLAEESQLNREKSLPHALPTWQSSTRQPQRAVAQHGLAVGGGSGRGVTPLSSAHAHMRRAGFGFDSTHAGMLSRRDVLRRCYAVITAS